MTAIAIADASWVGDGTFEYLKEAPRRSSTKRDGSHRRPNDCSGSAIMSNGPKSCKLASPLKIAAERLAWRAGGNISFHGQVTAAGGPQLSLLAVKNPQRLAVQNLTI